MQSKNPSAAVSNKKRDEWREHIKCWESSGLPQAAYCSNAGISYSSFVYWRGVFLSESNQAQPVSPFVPIKLASPSSTADVVQIIQIKLLSGHRVYLPIALGIQNIATIISQLGVSHA